MDPSEGSGSAIPPDEGGPREPGVCRPGTPRHALPERPRPRTVRCRVNVSSPVATRSVSRRRHAGSTGCRSPNRTVRGGTAAAAAQAVSSGRRPAPVGRPRTARGGGPAAAARGPAGRRCRAAAPPRSAASRSACLRSTSTWTIPVSRNDRAVGSSGMRRAVASRLRVVDRYRAGVLLEQPHRRLPRRARRRAPRRASRPASSDDLDLDLHLDVDRVGRLAVAGLEQPQVVDEAPGHPRRQLVGDPGSPAFGWSGYGSTSATRYGSTSGAHLADHEARRAHRQEVEPAVGVAAGLADLGERADPGDGELLGAAVARQHLAALADQHDAERRRRRRGSAGP